VAWRCFWRTPKEHYPTLALYFETFLDSIEDHWIDVLLCDPPYAVFKDSNPAAKKKKPTLQSAGKDVSWDCIPKEEFVEKIINRVISHKLKQKMSPKGVCLVHVADRYTSHWIDRIEEIGFYKKRTIKVIRSNPWMRYGIGGNDGKLWDLVHCSEDLLFFTLQKTHFHIQWAKHDTLRAMKDWIYYSHARKYIAQNGVSHPTQKPLSLLKKILSLFAFPGANVCDLFFGSGSLPVVCKKMHLNFKGSEINHLYWGLAVERVCRESGEDDIKETKEDLVQEEPT